MNRKKLIAIFTLVCFLFTFMPITAFAADSATGTFGQLTWTYENGVLTLTGQGAMNDCLSGYYIVNPPWEKYKTAITSVIISDGITSIGQHVFYNHAALRKVSLGKDVTVIEGSAFDSCTNLTHIELPEGFLELGSWAFAESGLKTITIPASVEVISNSFHCCSNLTGITVNPENQNFTSVDGVLFTKDMKELLCYPSGKQTKEYYVPDEVESFYDTAAFYECDAIEKIVFGQNMRDMSLNGIVNCPNLKEVVFNDGIEILYGIRNCDSLEKLLIPASVTRISTSTFYQCANLTGVYFYGDAPALSHTGGVEPVLADGFSLYYLDGKSGWTSPTWNDFPTAVWNGSTTSNPTEPEKPVEPEEPVVPGETVITGTNPVDGATNVGYDAADLPEFHMQFNKVPATMNGAGVQIDSTKEPFRIYRASDDKLIWEDPSGRLGGKFSTSMVINTNNTIVTVSPTNAHALLEKDTVYYITMGEGYIKFVDGTVSPAIEKWEWSFKTKNPDVSIVSDVTIKTGDNDTKNAVVSVEWKDSWFDNSSNYYMHDLATASMALSGASYVEKSGKPASEKIQEALTAFGFDDFQSFNYDAERTKLDNDIVSYSFAAKPVNDNGKTYTLVAVVVKGTSGDEEWYSNFNIGKGSQHEGFQICAEDVMDSLEEYVEELGLNSSNAKFLVTGHSRGAAVANLVAKEITDSSFAQARNVYGYTFATPAVVTDSNASKYNNIFNIVNGEDFVTRVPLANWNYKHYGIDLLLPSRSYYGAGYDEVYTAMSAAYSRLVHKGFESYNGTQKVDKLISDVVNLAPNVKQFYENKNWEGLTPYQYFYSLAYSLVNDDTGPLLVASASEYFPITAFFVDNHLLNPRVFGAHAMATYYSWMDSCTAEELFGDSNESTKRWFKRAIIACPVDVYVYDEAGDLVASVVDETVGANTLVVSVEDGVKTIDLPGDQTYSIKIVATDEGTVTYTVDEYQATASGDEIVRTVRFDDIAITAEDELTGEVNDTTYTASKNYALNKNEETVIYADYDSEKPSSSSSSGGGFSGSYNYPVTADKVDGAKVTFSDEYANKGETVTITVIPDSGKQVKEVIVTDKDGNVIAVTKVGENQYSFTMPEGQVNVSVTTEDADYELRIVMQINNKNILVNGKTMVNDVAPVIVADRTLVPIRVVTELLGGSAHWDNATRTVTLNIDGKVLSMTIGREILGFGTSAVIMNDRTYVPVRYVMEKLGADVEWINATRQIIIEK
ncbi:MAG: hypothetical protein E7195_09195 [Peptococcaceae bacterium]|nr:hypothetical protein [Peptococcaceae bacterium]